MSIDLYDVYFSGACLKQADPAEVKRKIGTIFKLEGEKLERLFRGKPVPIKRGVDMDRAIKFRVTFRDVGALVDIVPAGEPVTTPIAKPAPPSRPVMAAPTAPPQAGGLALADGPLPSVEAAQGTTVQIPEFGLSAPKDFNLSDCVPEVAPAPLPDISRLDLDKPGVTLDEHPEPEPLVINTESLILGEDDAPLSEEAEIQPPPIDTTGLTLSAPKEGSLEAYQVPVEPAPLPKIDHLDLEEASSSETAKSHGKATFQIAEE